ncbi:hypothetical protein EDB81DRAFT_229048 [Dactylonectria macrodidyma]|uniref:Uncharacterized protein n=1 Tax=Dactylonectria macrodidyma TaxID=307937 RepID=A0A9P9DLG2_9HYPO|nr:hypothetical protein EDB81DRAFT_229048 [Dactylonectria macrodidyma]
MNEQGRIMSTTPGSRDDDAHRCHHCNVTYERRDHLLRHLRAHENKRPHRCLTCGKGFNRADLLHRHGVAHTQPSSSTPLRRRTTQACDPCVKAKTRCDEERPCKRCKTRGWDCSGLYPRRYSTSKAITPPLTDGTPGPSTDLAATPQNDSCRASDELWDRDAHRDTPILDIDADAQALDRNVHRAQVVTPSRSACTDSEVVTISNVDMGHDSGGTVALPMLEQGMLGYDGNGGDALDFPDVVTQSNMTGLDDALHFDPELLGDVPFVLEGYEFDMLESVPSFLAGGLTRPSSSAGRYEASPQNDSSVKSGTSFSSEALLRSEAFRESVFSWIPEPKEGAFSDNDSIHVHEDTIHAGRLLISQARPGSERIKFDQRTRCDILRLVSKLASRSLVISSFPSTQLLEDLANVFLSVEGEALGSFIHSGTCDINTLRTELLLSMVAGGARLIALEPVWKLGLVLQEVIRIAITEKIEEDNSLSRHPQAWKGMLICLEIGAFSGFRRKTEIALSFLQPLVTMMTWARVFQPDGYDTIAPQMDDSDEALQAKWCRWAEQEALKRLLVHTFLFDSQLAIAHTKNPLLSPAQMQFPLPAAPELWHAPTAQAWRDAYVRLNESSSHKSVLVVDIFRDSGLLGELSPLNDRALCTLAACHRVGHEVWHYRQQMRLRTRNRGADRLSVLGSLRWDLYEDLAMLQSLRELNDECTPSITMTIELLSMLLHVDLEDVQVYCGKSSPDEARKAIPRMAAWVSDPESRIAVWHAGQVFRVARAFDKAKLRDFYAMALYQAALTLWAYGMAYGSFIMTGEKVTASLSQVSGGNLVFGARSNPTVFLDGDDERLAVPFKRLAHGTPGICNMDSEFVPLYNLPNLMSTAASLLRSSFSQVACSPPSLVENLACLLDKLGSLSNTEKVVD